MATTKTKGTNAKIKELKGIKPEKVTDEQLTKIQGIVDKITDVQLNKVQSTVRTMDSVIMELGRMAVQRHGTLKGLENIYYYIV